MHAELATLRERITSVYAKDGDNVDFAEFVRGRPDLDDDQLAELIEHDGRLRITNRRVTTLDRYLAAVPDLFSRRDPLDAALDVTLRWMSRAARADEAAVQSLIEAYPQIEDEIRDAAALNNALWSTAGLQRKVAGAAVRALPQDFGPPMDNGRPRYELVRLLGRGAFGEVYQAVDRQLSEEDHLALVAVKILNRSDSFARRLWSRPRVLEEATKARRVDHPNVVRVLDRGVSADDEDFIVYELIDGGDLEQWLAMRREPIPPADAARLAANIARGVQAAHSAGLVHCDLKPGNIILTNEGNPKVADFGIAIRFGQSDSQVYANAHAADREGKRARPIGNMAYISPEQYRMDEGALTVPSDVYALGGILFTILTGELPNGSNAEEISQTHDPVHGRTTPPSVRALRPEIDRDLDAICRRAMAIKPDDRYSSAGALAEDLESWLRHEPLYWTKPSALRVINLWRRRKPAVAITLGLLVISIIGGMLGANYFAQRAAEAELEAAIAEAAKEVAETGRRELAKFEAQRQQMLQTFRAMMIQYADSGRASSQMLPLAWSFEYLMGRDVMAVPEAAADLHRVRFDTVQRLVDSAVEQGRGNHIETLLWRTTLCFWMTASGEHERAEPLLDDLIDLWEARIMPDDHWLMYVRAIHACAVVKRIAARGEQSPLGDQHREQLSAAVQVLVTSERLIDGADTGSPLHFLVMQTLAQAYSPDVLDLTDHHRAMQGKLKEASQRRAVRLNRP